MANPILSILVITHNQRDLLKRCLDSVLGQKLNVSFEVIVSDDRSNDGTAEYVAELQEQIVSGKKVVPNLQEIVYTRCNSDECDPQNVSERCGWNKLNVYNHARGEYFVNIDADDYLRSDDIYQTQFNTLKAHPECSMCMQDVYPIKDGEKQSLSKPWPSFGRLQNGQVLDAYSIISDYRALNQCYMIRRHQEVNCAERYGKYFDDTVITLHHLQFGPVVFVDRSDYVWVQYNTSITKTLQGDDNVVEYGLLPLHHIRFIPVFATLFMHEGLKDVIHMLKQLAKNGYRWQLTERTQAAFRETPGRIYRVFSHPKSTLFDRIYLRYVRIIVLFYSRFGCTNWKYLYGLLIDRKIASKINWENKYE